MSALNTELYYRMLDTQSPAQQREQGESEPRLVPPRAKHWTRFYTMREICKEEDYAFLEKVEDSRDKGGEQDKLEEEKLRERHEERIRRSQERKQKEEERQRELEEMRKQKEQEWKSHVAELAAEREGALKERAIRLREFRSFQRKVLEKEMDLGQGNGCEKIECD